MGIHTENMLSVSYNKQRKYLEIATNFKIRLSICISVDLTKKEINQICMNKNFVPNK